MLTPGKGSLRITGNSQKKIPSPWVNSSACCPSPGQMAVGARFTYGGNFIDLSDAPPKLCDFQQDLCPDSNLPCNSGSCAGTEKFLFHTSGIYQVEVYDNPDGTPYDGNDHGIINMKGKYMFTWELLQETLDHQGVSRTSIKGIFRAKAKGWRRNSMNLQSQSLKDKISDILDTSHVQDVFTDALFDYLTLLDIDYDQTFMCKCDSAGGDSAGGPRLDSDGVTLIYDNACNLLHSILKRMPSMLEHYKFFVDSLHWAGHKHCSPYFNKAMSVALSGINSQLCEQRNRVINYLKTSAAFMSQPRGLVWVR